MRELRHGVEEIQPLFMTRRQSLRPGEIRRYRLDLLERLAGQVHAHSAECATCRNASVLIDHMIRECGSSGITAERQKENRITLEHISWHLRKEHGISAPGHFSKMGLIFGVVLGAGLSSLCTRSFLNFPLAACMLFGTVAGLLAGTLLDLKTRGKNG